MQVCQDPSRALTLGRQAAERQWLIWSEPLRLYIIAAALHAVRCGKDNPCGLFVWLLKHPEQGSPLVNPEEPEAQAILKRTSTASISSASRSPHPRLRRPTSLRMHTWWTPCSGHGHAPARMAMPGQNATRKTPPGPASAGTNPSAG